MVAVPVEDWDLVAWDAKYFEKVQLWKEGEEKDWSGSSEEAWQSIHHLKTRGNTGGAGVCWFWRKGGRRWQFVALLPVLRPAAEVTGSSFRELDTADDLQDAARDVAEPVQRAVPAP